MKAVTTLLAIMLMVTSGEVFGQEAETFALQPENEPVQVEELPPTPRQRAIACLATNMYYESRGEPRKGQLAVGLVTINRAKSGQYPDDICEVVTQRKQFSWYKPGMSVRGHANELYQEIKEAATLLYDEYYVANTFVDFVQGATHFHTRAVNPPWRNKRKVAQIGGHIFFRIGK